MIDICSTVRVVVDPSSVALEKLIRLHCCCYGSCLKCIQKLCLVTLWQFVVADDFKSCISLRIQAVVLVLSSIGVLLLWHDWYILSIVIDSGDVSSATTIILIASAVKNLLRRELVERIMLNFVV